MAGQILGDRIRVSCRGGFCASRSWDIGHEPAAMLLPSAFGYPVASLPLFGFEPTGILKALKILL